MAQEYCVAQGGYLATITSPEEDEFLFSYIMNTGYSTVMFGLTDQEQTDNWRWVTGEKFSYQNWRSGEANHYGGYEHYGIYCEKIPMVHGMMEAVEEGHFSASGVNTRLRQEMDLTKDQLLLMIPV